MRRMSTALVPAVVVVLLAAAGCGGASTSAGGGGGASSPPVGGGTRPDGSRDTLAPTRLVVQPAKGCAAAAPGAPATTSGDTAGSKVVVSVGLSGVKRSEDGGATWTQVKVGDNDDRLTATS